DDRFQDAVSRDPFAPLPPPGLPPLPGSLSVFRGLIAPARATLAKTVALGGGCPRSGQGPRSARLWVQAPATRFEGGDQCAAGAVRQGLWPCAPRYQPTPPRTSARSSPVCPR